MSVKLLFNNLPAFLDSSGNPANGYKLHFFAAGSTTYQNVYQDSGGLSAHANPISLNSRGEPPAAIWGTVGLTYKMILSSPTDSNPPVTAIETVDNITGINDASISIDQWVASGLTPTYIGATSFSLSGDQTTTFHIGRKLKSTITAGTGYHTITNSSFGAGITTVTVNGTSLDSGLSAIAYGILSADNPSVPGLQNIGDILIRRSSTAIGAASAPNMPVNMTIAFSVGSSALTIAIKDRAGNDPSPASPVLIPFRNATAATGDYSWLVLTTATSLVVSSGSTLGTSNSTPFRLWIVAFNDANTLRLGVVNCLSGTSIFPLSGWGIASSTAEGGAGAADSAHVIYTGSAVSSKAYTVLGYAAYDSLATAGTWSATPARSQLLTAGVRLPGDVIQSFYSSTGTAATGTVVIPNDNSIPQSGEGDQYLSQAITPSSMANVLRIECQAMLANSAATYQMSMALFQDANANAIAAEMQSSTTNQVARHTLEHEMLAATVSATTFKIRAGGSGAGTTTFNGQSGANTLGGVERSFLRVSELMA